VRAWEWMDGRLAELQSCVQEARLAVGRSSAKLFGRTRAWHEICLRGIGLGWGETRHPLIVGGQAIGLLERELVSRVFQASYDYRRRRISLPHRLDLPTPARIIECLIRPPPDGAPAGGRGGMDKKIGDKKIWRSLVSA
jgi:hypothetical protein